MMIGLMLIEGGILRTIFAGFAMTGIGAAGRGAARAAA